MFSLKVLGLFLIYDILIVPILKAVFVYYYRQKGLLYLTIQKIIKNLNNGKKKK